MTNYAHAECTMCGKQDYCGPLHGDKGGPICCLKCLGKWHGEHGRRRKWGRIVVRAIAAYLDVGGKFDDLDKLKIAAGGLGFDPLGYGTENLIDGDAPELTSELLTRAISLTHPDKHPSERRELAASVTGELIAFQPFVFPARKKEQPAPDKSYKPPKRKTTETVPKLEHQYPCVDCADAVPADYCDACRAEYDKREQEDFERRTAKQRAQYAQRRQEVLAVKPPAVCAVCGKGFKSKRADSRYCSDRCRQKAHRKSVTDKSSRRSRTSFSRDKVEGVILALLDRHRAIYQNDLLPANRTSAEYQAVSLVAAKLEAEGKIEIFSYLYRWGYPGSKVLVKPGHIIEDRKVALLKDHERLKGPPK
jgi:predicted nucleic acid-binding Zn ribbon protein